MATGQPAAPFSFSSLANAFRTTPAPAQPAPNANPALPNTGQPNNTVVNPNNNNQPVDRSTGMPVNANPNADPNNPNPDPANTNKQTGSPLDAFQDIFKIDPNKQPAKNPLEDKLFNLDPKKLGDAVSKLDFTRGLNPESIQKALQGDVAEFGNIMNHVTRSAYMMSTQMLLSMMEGGIRTNNERFTGTLDGKFRDFNIQSASSSNPALNHPSAKPVVSALKQHIAQQNPSLSPAEVQKQAEDYFLAMGKAMNTVGSDLNPGDPNNPNAGKEEDWSNYLNLG